MTLLTARPGTPPPPPSPPPDPSAISSITTSPPHGPILSLRPHLASRFSLYPIPLYPRSTETRQLTRTRKRRRPHHVSHSVQVQYLLCDHDSPLEETPPRKDGSNPPLPRSASEKSFISPPRLHGSTSYFFFFIDFMDFLDFFIERFIDLFAILREGCVLQVSETKALFLFRFLKKCKTHTQTQVRTCINMPPSLSPQDISDPLL